MGNFMETAEAVEPIIRMLAAGGRRYVSVEIFNDGSGHISVRRSEKDDADVLMRQHGVDLRGGGRRSLDNTDSYHFAIILNELKKYSETLCPHCGKDITAVL